MKYTVEVTQADIDFGIRGNGVHCPLARAISRCTGKHACVGIRCWYFTGDSSPYMPLPDDAARLRRGFDYGNTVSPITFELEVPDA